MKAKLLQTIYWTDGTNDGRIPLGTEGKIEPCTCACSSFDYHFFPDTLGGDVLIGVEAHIIEILTVIESEPS